MLDKKVADLINTQVNKEFYSAYLYLCLLYTSPLELSFVSSKVSRFLGQARTPSPQPLQI